MARPPAVANSTTSVRRTVQRIRNLDISKILSPNREATVKAFVGSALLIAVFALGAPAFPAGLLTGIVRDSEGGSVSGVLVRAYDAGGAQIGQSTGARDGTFAIDVEGTPHDVLVQCQYCQTVRLPVRDGEPVVAIVHRYAALRDRTASSADLAALPYRALDEVASLVPFAVSTANGISDRGLDRGRGAIVLNGIPFYGFFNGSDPALEIPAHAATSLTESSPLDAASYGVYANGGVFNVGTNAGPNRVDTGDTSDVALRASGNTLRGVYDVSDSPGGHRALTSGGVTTAFAGGTLNFDAVSLTDAPTTASGAILSYQTGSRRFETFANLEATRSMNTISSSTIDQSDVRADIHIRDRGPLGLEFGARLLRSTGVQIAGPFSNGGAQHEEAIYAQGRAGSDNSSLSFSGAFQRDGAHIQTSGIVASLGYDKLIGKDWTFHAGIGSNIRPLSLGEIESFGAPVLDRSAFTETSLQYSDNRRWRLEAMGYSENIDGPTDVHTAGVGLNGAWQISQHFSLRSWILRAVTLESAPYAVQPTPPTPVEPLRGNLLWLTYTPHDGGIRIDALSRGKALEGDMVLPLAHDINVVLGTLVRNGTRFTSFGLQLP
jgi:hypothetical protein